MRRSALAVWYHLQFFHADFNNTMKKISIGDGEKRTADRKNKGSKTAPVKKPPRSCSSP